MDNQRFLIRSGKYNTPIRVLVVVSLFFFVLSIFLPLNIFMLIASLVAIVACVLLAVSVFSKEKNMPKFAVFAVVAVYTLLSAISIFIFQILLCLAFVAALVWLTVCVYNGGAKPKDLIFIASTGIAIEALLLPFAKFLSGWISGVFASLGMICLYVVIILLALDEKAAGANGDSDVGIEKQLAMLKSALDSGIITEEQYQEKRSKILGNL